MAFNRNHSKATAKKKVIQGKRTSQHVPLYLIILVLSSIAVCMIWLMRLLKIFFLLTFRPPDENNGNALDLKDVVNPKWDRETLQRYILLRREYDAIRSVSDSEQIKTFVQSVRNNEYATIRPQDMSYDIRKCPDYPPDDYPYAWNVLQVLKNWDPNDTSPRKNIFHGLCIFDYEADRDKALNYRKAEVPFILENDPDVLRTVERWNHPEYLVKLLGNTRYMTELSLTNKYIYWNKPRKTVTTDDAETLALKDHWEPPTSMTRMNYKDWLRLANVTDSSLTGPNSPHFYLRLTGCGSLGQYCDSTPAEFLYNELPFFTNSLDGENFYIVDPNGQRGIHCRFGMKGIIIENHYDASRNFIVVLKGQRRYILSHPSQCKYLDLYPPGHPSARHSSVDWTDPDLHTHPNFAHAKVTELVLQAGDMLYLPTNWFHYIVNLDLNVQCNSRSGKSITYDKYLSDCGFSDMLRGT